MLIRLEKGNFTLNRRDGPSPDTFCDWAVLHHAFPNLRHLRFVDGSPRPESPNRLRSGVANVVARGGWPSLLQLEFYRAIPSSADPTVCDADALSFCTEVLASLFHRRTVLGIVPLARATVGWTVGNADQNRGKARLRPDRDNLIRLRNFVRGTKVFMGVDSIIHGVNAAEDVTIVDLEKELCLRAAE